MRSSKKTFLIGFGIPLTGLIALLLLAAGGLLLWLTSAQNALQAEQENHLARAALESRIGFERRSIGNYSIWNDTVTNMILGKNYEWADANLGPYLYANQNYEYNFVIGPDDRAIYASRKDKRVTMEAADAVGSNLPRIIEDLRRHPPGEDQRSITIEMVDGLPAIVSIASIIPSDDAVARPDQPASYFVMIKRMDQPVLAELAKNYGLKNLRFVSRPGRGAGLELKDGAGRPIGGLVWQVAKPGDALMNAALPLLAALVLLAIAGSWMVLRRSWMVIRTGDAAQQEALARAEEAAEAQRQLVNAERSRQVELEDAVARVRRENEALNAGAEQARAEAAQSEARLLTEIADAIETELASFSSALDEASIELGGRSADVHSAAESAHRSSDQLIDASRQTSNSLSEIVPTTENLARTFEDVRRQALATRGAVGAVRKTVDDVSRQLSLTGETAEAIEVIARSIAGLAQQTNLLALNASIEAARAGESGRGFAVVATEVKALAANTAALTSRAEAQIAEIRSAAKASSEAVEQMSDVLKPAFGAAEMIVSSVEEQAMAVNAIDDQISRIAGLANKVATLAREAGDSASQGYATAEAVSSASQGVVDRSGELNASVSALAHRIRMRGGGR